MPALPIYSLLAGLVIAVTTAFGDQRGIPEAMMKIVTGSKKKWITSGQLGTPSALVSNFEIKLSVANGYRRGISPFKQE